MRRTGAIAGALAWSLAGCAAVTTTIDWNGSYDFSVLATYEWIARDLPPGVDPATIDEIIGTADSILRHKGYVRDPDGASFLVAYQFGAEADIAPRPSANPYTRDTHTQVSTHSRLILDVIDPETDEAIWSGSAGIEARPGDTHKNAPLIRKAVQELLSGFPPDSAPPR
ncbi:MAG: DUF4136 domain-containing protein [Gemmatimonadota bacterium]|nr:MAG: DUF4136 domain-containing protein [Gemmatimonadota bacterium]